ncbi:hypothetical protein KUTeg_008355 [Tegillarca granosa]|uniref:PiggyBac transposable element-derived protein domain-containing protein n=1 Tax=Tegillarca granosa TaxID=220873 RepID=A0ABQ9F8Y0_TEGGR|nr:hypothetical protein KUTeg_008355 [Tegillarca granosa]
MESDSSGEEFEGWGPNEAAEAAAFRQRMLERDGIGDISVTESESESESDNEVPVDGWHQNFDFYERGFPHAFDPRGATGPTQILAPEKNIIDFFQLFLTDELIEFILNETDHFANQEKQNHPDRNKMAWSRPTLAEMKAFFGICF